MAEFKRKKLLLAILIGVVILTVSIVYIITLPKSPPYATFWINDTDKWYYTNISCVSDANCAAVLSQYPVSWCDGNIKQCIYKSGEVISCKTVEDCPCTSAFGCRCYSGVCQKMLAA